MKRAKILSIILSLLMMYENKVLSSNDGYYSEYQNGVVYIGNEEYLQSIKELSDNDILVLDERWKKDPNMKIFNSYLISNPEIQIDILKILLEYEKQDHSLWNRTIESMQREWYLHNLMVFFSYKLERTCDVDFNNQDEEKYKGEFWKRKILK